MNAYTHLQRQFQVLVLLNLQKTFLFELFVALRLQSTTLCTRKKRLQTSTKTCITLHFLRTKSALSILSARLILRAVCQATLD